MKENSIIAIFMGAEEKEMASRKYYVFSDSKQPWLEELKYYRSFDWLMPVVEKIRTTGWDFDINSGVDVDWQTHVYSMDATLCRNEDKDLLNAIYKSVVEYIEYYNRVTLSNNPK